MTRENNRSSNGAGPRLSRLRRSRLSRQPLPPPDPATRVELDGPQRAGQHTRMAELTVLAGVAGLLAATASKFVEIIHLPSSSELSVAVFALALVVLGLVQRRRLESLPVTNTRADITAEVPVTPPDLPSLTAEIAELLFQLRHDYGLAYRTSTWLDDVLPIVGFETSQPELTRDVLAVSALDAGGIRADVTALTNGHAAVEVVASASALLVALRSVRDVCDQRELGIGHLPQSDQSSWSALPVA